MCDGRIVNALEKEGKKYCYACYCVGCKEVLGKGVPKVNGVKFPRNFLMYSS